MSARHPSKNLILAALLLAGCSNAAPVGDGNAEPAYLTGPQGFGVSGEACAFTQEDWGSACGETDIACLRDQAFSDLYVDGFTVGVYLPLNLASAEDIENYLPQSGDKESLFNSAFFGQMTALKLNIDHSNAGLFGPDGDFAEATMLGGTYHGLTAQEILDIAEATDPAESSSSLYTAMATLNTGFPGCTLDTATPTAAPTATPTAVPTPDPTAAPTPTATATPEASASPSVEPTPSAEPTPTHYCPTQVIDHPTPPPEEDEDGDGVPTWQDCDDQNAAIGKLLYQDDFDADTGFFDVGPKLQDPWVFEDGFVKNTEGGQQALLGQPRTWQNTVTFATLSTEGSIKGCDGDDCPTDRYRAGILARAQVDEDQDEGYHGYRCAVARNAATDCYEPGPFVQLAAFMDAPEDDISSECADDCPVNTTFDQLDRVNRSEGTNLLKGDAAQLTFWAVGNQLVCEFEGKDDEHIVTRAQDDSFGSGGTGLSTLNALGAFDSIKVCEAFTAPNGD